MCIRDSVPDSEEVVEKHVFGKLRLLPDLMFCNEIAFLLSITRKLCLLIVIYVPDKSASTLRTAIDKVMDTYTANEFTISEMMTDGESAIGALIPYYQSKGILTDVAPKGQHVPEVERAIRHVKEKARAVYNTLPYTLTNMMIVYLVYYAVRCINMFPKKGSVDPDQSPREMFTGRKVDYKLECLLQFGEYCQVAEEDDRTNSLKERTVGAVCLGPCGNGAYHFISLKTWKVVQRRAWY